MTRYVLRKGFSLISAEGGASHLSDTRTGDALVIPEIDLGPLTAAAMGGLPLDAVGSAGVLERYAAFLIEGDEATARGFYELDIEDAPGLANAGPIIPAVRPGEDLRKVIESARQTPAADGEAELRRALEVAKSQPEPATSPSPNGEDELRAALAKARTSSRRSRVLSRCPRRARRLLRCSMKRPASSSRLRRCRSLRRSLRPVACPWC
jgi:hypothetical protein